MSASGGNENNRILIHVVFPHGAVEDYTVLRDSFVWEIKCLITKNRDIEPDGLTILFVNNELQDLKTLVSYGVRDGSSLKVFPRLNSQRRNCAFVRTNDSGAALLLKMIIECEQDLERQCREIDEEALRHVVTTLPDAVTDYTADERVKDYKLEEILKKWFEDNNIQLTPKLDIQDKDSHSTKDLKSSRQNTESAELPETSDTDGISYEVKARTENTKLNCLEEDGAMTAEYSECTVEPKRVVLPDRSESEFTLCDELCILSSDSEDSDHTNKSRVLTEVSEANCKGDQMEQEMNIVKLNYLEAEEGTKTAEPTEIKTGSVKNVLSLVTSKNEHEPAKDSARYIECGSTVINSSTAEPFETEASTTEKVLPALRSANELIVLEEQHFLPNDSDQNAESAASSETPEADCHGPIMKLHILIRTLNAPEEEKQVGARAAKPSDIKIGASKNVLPPVQSENENKPPEAKGTHGECAPTVMNVDAASKIETGAIKKVLPHVRAANEHSLCDDLYFLPDFSGLSCKHAQPRILSEKFKANHQSQNAELQKRARKVNDSEGAENRFSTSEHSEIKKDTIKNMPLPIKPADEYKPTEHNRSYGEYTSAVINVIGREAFENLLEILNFNDIARGRTASRDQFLYELSQLYDDQISANGAGGSVEYVTDQESPGRMNEEADLILLHNYTSVSDNSVPEEAKCATSELYQTDHVVNQLSEKLCNKESAEEITEAINTECPATEVCSYIRNHACEAQLSGSMSDNVIHVCKKAVGLHKSSQLYNVEKTKKPYSENVMKNETAEMSSDMVNMNESLMEADYYPDSDEKKEKECGLLDSQYAQGEKGGEMLESKEETLLTLNAENKEIMFEYACPVGPQKLEDTSNISQNNQSGNKSF